MSVGYAAFQTSFNVKGSTAITGNWNIEVTNVAVAETEGSGENAKTPTWTQTTANMEANLYEPGDSVKYIVTIQNKGNIDAKLENIITSGETSSEAQIVVEYIQATNSN